MCDWLICLILWAATPLFWITAAITPGIFEDEEWFDVVFASFIPILNYVLWIAAICLSIDYYQTKNKKLYEKNF